MNIQDVKDLEVPKVDIWRAMEERQLELMVKYREIESIPDWPLQFQNRESQRWFKDFLWRIHEEICEGQEALEQAQQVLLSIVPGIDLKAPLDESPLLRSHITHFFEEISDALHFLLELSILTGHRASKMEFDPVVAVFEATKWKPLAKMGLLFLNPEDYRVTIQDRADLLVVLRTTRHHCNDLSYHLGLLGNILKLKPWKQADIESDESKFKSRLLHFTNSMIMLLVLCGLSPVLIYVLYAKKAAVNTWRQKTNY